MKKLPIYWTSKTPVRYKRNTIIDYSELRKANKIGSNFDIEIKSIVNKTAPNTFFLSIITLIVVKTI